MKNHDRRRDGDDQRDGRGHDANAPSDAALQRIAEALRGIQYGSVVVIVQDGVVVQIERTEKTRISRSST